MSGNDQHYYIARSAEERTKAARAVDTRAARVHLEMAERYETWAAGAKDLPLSAEKLVVQSPA
jgi:hypothetical protein